jgi:hypothetical protein
MTSARSSRVVRLAAPLLVTAALLGALASARQITKTDPGAGRAAGAADRSPRPVVVGSDASTGIASWASNLTPDQLLDRSLSDPATHGVMRGVTGAPKAVELPNPGHQPDSVIATDFPFTVQAFFGREASPYAIGSTIALRIPGGAAGNIRMTAEDAPQIQAGEHLYVFVRDLGPLFEGLWGRNSSNLLVANTADDVYSLSTGLVSA